MRSLIINSLCALFALGFVSQTQAQDKKVDGTWAWTMPGRNGGPDRKITLKLKTEGDKVTGKILAPTRQDPAAETEIKDGKLAGDDLSFTVIREGRNGKMTFKYKGKVSADSIKGKVEFGPEGDTQSRDWEAKRDTEKK
jgi:hypothetical protein